MQLILYIFKEQCTLKLPFSKTTLLIINFLTHVLVKYSFDIQKYALNCQSLVPTSNT